MLTDTVADRLSLQGALEDDLPAILRMIGEDNMAARYVRLVRAADALHEAVEACSRPGEDVFGPSIPVGCDESTLAAIDTAHHAAMVARDTFFAHEIKPLIDEAKRISGRSDPLA